jgi:UTP--glucose-1-phosphate uridylyltransferase
MSSRVRKAVFPVAGFGTRVLPATKSLPKEMLPVFDRPALHWVVEEAAQAGIEHFVFVTGRNKTAIEDYFDRSYELEDTLRRAGKTAQLTILEQMLPVAGSYSFVRQQSPLGLGHAVWCARDVIGDEPFAVLLPDVLIQARRSCLAQMLDVHATVGGNLIAVDEIPAEAVSSYGVIAHGPARADGLLPVTGLVEKPSPQTAPSRLKITGRYLLEPDIFRLLESQERGAGGEIQLTDSMLKLAKTRPFHALVYEGQDYDCGSRLGYAQAYLAYALKDPELGGDVRAVAQALLG